MGRSDPIRNHERSVSSAHARPGDRLDFVVVRDVSVEGFTVIPAGTVAGGSVTGG